MVQITDNILPNVNNITYYPWYWHPPLPNVTGWICPRCNRVYSPYVTSCNLCVAPYTMTAPYKVDTYSANSENNKLFIDDVEYIGSQPPVFSCYSVYELN